MGHDWQVIGRRLTPVFLLDDWQGPTDAIIECSACGRYGLIAVQDWAGKNLSTRVYTAALLDSDTVAVFVRNMRSDYCDLTRRTHEMQALIATAQSPSTALAACLPGLDVIAAREIDGGPSMRKGSWRDAMPALDDDSWFTYLGLAKGTD